MAKDAPSSEVVDQDEAVAWGASQQKRRQMSGAPRETVEDFPFFFKNKKVERWARKLRIR